MPQTVRRSISKSRRSFFAPLPKTSCGQRNSIAGLPATPSSPPPFLTEAPILHSESNAGELLKIFARSISEWASDADPSSEVDEASDDDSVVTIEAVEAKKPGKVKQASTETAAAEAKNPGKAKQASAETAAAKTLATIADDCDDVLAFLQAVAVKSP